MGYILSKLTSQLVVPTQWFSYLQGVIGLLGVLKWIGRSNAVFREVRMSNLHANLLEICVCFLKHTACRSPCIAHGVHVGESQEGGFKN